MKVGFIGLGKLGRDAAEVLAEKHDVVGYDPNINVEGLSGTLEEACKDKDVVLVAVQTPHDPKYGGETPTSHLEPKDFDYKKLSEKYEVPKNLLQLNFDITRLTYWLIVSDVKKGGCFETTKPTTPIATIAYAIPRYPKTGFFEKVDTI